jgi:hypothetical protein
VKLVNTLFEKQAIALAYSNPGMLDDLAHPRNEKLDRIGPLLADPFAKCAWSALKKVRAMNPPAMAEAMARNGMPGMTVERLNEELLVYGQEGMAAPSIEWAIKALEELWRARTATPIIEKHMREMQAGLISPAEMGQAIASATAMMASGDSMRSISTDNWSPEWAREIQADQRKLMAAGKLARIPPEFETIQRRVRFMESGILTILMDTGAGKSILVDILAHFWARQGLKVDMFITETALKMQLWRYQLREVNRQRGDKPLPQVQDLQEGLDDERLAAVTKPCANGGRVKYIAAGGAEISTCLAVMESDKAQVGIFDVAHDFRFSAWMNKSHNETFALMEMLQDVSTRCQAKGQLMVFTLQTDKAGRRNARSGGSLGAADAMGGSPWENKSDWAWTANFLTTECNVAIPHPWMKTAEGRPVSIDIPEGSMLPVGVIKASKGRTGGAGWQQMVWREGQHYDMFGINDKPRIDFYGQGYIWKKKRKAAGQ